MALRGIKVIEMAGLAPGPFCGMIFADFGASVIRVDKTNAVPLDRLSRGKRSIALNLKNPEAVAVIKKLTNQADILIEPYRPGILSMLGGSSTTPEPPLNLLADFAGGGLLCSLGILMALFERTKTGLGQIIDASMSEGAAYVGSWLYKSRDLPVWGESRGKTWFDGGTHFYGVYETKDNKFMSVGAIEGQFYKLFLEKLDLNPNDWPQFSESPEVRRRELANIFKTKNQDEWTQLFNGLDGCVLPVLSLDEAPSNPHNKYRENFFKNLDGLWEPTPAPRMSNHTPVKNVDFLETLVGKHSKEILLEIGYTENEADKMILEGVVDESNTLKSNL
ncbi:alpha-methylacyl-CoA racemase-like isoform X2 [Artemia franciscana]|uniref:alpha-methylacyl-CoA racemase-like isoform X2 n=1 Tax=Artemia franciscana TaxID=6661 RepID=UPI0032DBF099